jgi:hypothetical protein
MWHPWKGGGICREFWLGSTKEKDHLEVQSVDVRVGSKWTLGRLAGGVLIGFT